MWLIARAAFPLGSGDLRQSVTAPLTAGGQFAHLTASASIGTAIDSLNAHQGHIPCHAAAMPHSRSISSGLCRAVLAVSRGFGRFGAAARLGRFRLARHDHMRMADST
jgi:hypothetical protein